MAAVAQPWTDADDEALRRAAQDRIPWREIAVRMGRAHTAVRKRASRIGALAVGARTGAPPVTLTPPPFEGTAPARALAALGALPAVEVDLMLARHRGARGVEAARAVLADVGLRPEPPRVHDLVAGSAATALRDLTPAERGQAWLFVGMEAEEWSAYARGCFYRARTGLRAPVDPGTGAAAARWLDDPATAVRWAMRIAPPPAFEAPAPGNPQAAPGQLRALDLYCGGGGAARGLIAAGWHVTGVDAADHHRGQYPGRFVCADVLELDPADLTPFDLVWASPPCQRFSVATPEHARARHPDLIEATRALLAASAAATVIENVPGAPVRPDVVLSGPMVGLPHLRRRRLFEITGFPAPLPLSARAAPPPGQTVTVVRRGPTVQGRAVASERAAEVMGLAGAGMSLSEIGEAVPPAYAECIGAAVAGHLQDVGRRPPSARSGHHLRSAAIERPAPSPSTRPTVYRGAGGELHIGDARQVLPRLSAASVDCIVTSPPYWRRRDYGGGEGEIGREGALAEYLDALAATFRAAARVLRSRGTLWLVIGDTYLRPEREDVAGAGLVGIPGQLADRLRAEGWALHCDLAWEQPGRGRPPKRKPAYTSQRIQMWARAADYWYADDVVETETGGVWRLAADRGHSGHPAPFPVALAERCILRGCPPGGAVLDPFGGSGSTAAAALATGRRATLVELHPDHAAADV